MNKLQTITNNTILGARTIAGVTIGAVGNTVMLTGGVISAVGISISLAGVAIEGKENFTNRCNATFSWAYKQAMKYTAKP